MLESLRTSFEKLMPCSIIILISFFCTLELSVCCDFGTSFLFFLRFYLLNLWVSTLVFFFCVVVLLLFFFIVCRSFIVLFNGILISDCDTGTEIIEILHFYFSQLQFLSIRISICKELPFRFQNFKC